MSGSRKERERDEPVEGPANGKGEEEGLESVLDDGAGPVVPDPALLNHLGAKALVNFGVYLAMNPP